VNTMLCAQGLTRQIHRYQQMVDRFEQAARANACVHVVRLDCSIQGRSSCQRMVKNYRPKIGGLQLGRVIRLYFCGHKVQYLVDRMVFVELSHSGLLESD